MTPISETRGIILMLLSIIFFTVNTLAVRAIALAYPACDGWEVTLFRGIAGTAVVLTLYSRSGQLRLKSLLDRPKVIARGILGALGVVIFYITIIKLGAARAVVINLTYPIFAAILARGFLKESLLPIATGVGAWIFFNETFGIIELSGAALTLMATMMVNPRTSKTPLKTLTNQPTT